MSDITPQRLDELLAGDPPRTDAERDVLHMAAALRAAAPETPDRLRERVMSTARTAPAGTRFRLPAFSAPWMGPAVAGVAAVVLGAAVFLPGIGGSGGGDPVITATAELTGGEGRSAGPEAGDDGTRLPETAQAPAPPEAAAPEVSPSAVAPDATAIAARAVVRAPGDGWPASALEAVAGPVEASGGVVTSASTGKSLDGREDLTIEALVPAGREAQAVDAVTAALPPETAWQPSGEERTPLDGDAAGDTVRPGAAPKDLAGADAVPVTVVVVRDTAP